MRNDQNEYLDQRQRIDRKVIERAMEDQAFRERLVSDPKATLEDEYGVRIPETANVQVLEENAITHYFVLPPSTVGELSDEELEAVAGGFNFLWSLICIGGGSPDDGE